LASSRSSREVEKRRAFHFFDSFIRNIFPGVLDEMDEAEKEWAGKFRALPKIDDETAIRRSRGLVSSFADFLAAPSPSPAPSSLLKKKYLDLARALARALALDLARALARARALDLDLALDLALDLPPETINRLIFQPSFEAIETALAITE
jgi:hypothetical protein